MTRKIHYHSWPIDRAFTFTEWCDYLDTHKDDTDRTVATFNGWKFNIHGVCINRRCAVQKFINRPGAKFEVETFQAPAGRKHDNPLAWNYTAYYSDGTSGGSAGWGEVAGDETKNEAIREKLVNYIKEHPQWRLSLQTQKILKIR